MSESPYINFYTSDFLGGTGGMTASTKGVYITILCLIYETEGPLPQKWDVLARRCGCTLPAFKRAVSDLVDDDKLEITEAGLWSDKCTKHIEQRRERRNSAKAAANKRWGKSVQKQGAVDANAKREQCHPEPEPDKKEDTDVSSKGGKPPFANELSEAIAIYNEFAERVGWPQAQKTTSVRRTTIEARLKDCGGIEGWRHAMERAAASDFLCGRNDREWTGFSLDWVRKQSNFTKLMEGNYDNRQASNSAPSGGRETHAERRSRIVAAAARGSTG